MKGIHVVLQLVGCKLILLLVSRWGLPLVLLGMLALAGSTAAYLGSTGNQPARSGMSRPDAATTGMFYGSRCWRDYVSATPHTCALLGQWPTQADTN